MNVSLAASPQLDHHYLNFLRDLEALIPDENTDETEDGIFSRDIDEDEVADGKAHAYEHNLDASPGCDETTYRIILNIPNDVLAKFLNECVTKKKAPSKWLLALVIGILKLGKPADDPAGYRLIVMECTCAKLLAFIIDRRIRIYAERKKLLPDSQNGFRPTYRTTNNPLILKTLIDKAASQKRPLYFAYMDWRNAFPTTHRPMLWIKLASMGVKGPIIDWLRMMYRKMEYVVKVCGSHSDPFSSNLGVITGNPSSPMLFDLGVSDFKLTIHPADVILFDTVVNLLMHADDTGLVTTCPIHMQSQLGQFEHYAGRTGFECSVPKCLIIIHNAQYEKEKNVKFTLHGRELQVVKDTKYIGAHFQSSKGNMFKKHYETYAKKASRASGAILHAKSFVGNDMAVWDSLELYRGRVEPYLMNGAEYSPDTVDSLTSLLKDVQHKFLRRVLYQQKHSSLDVLFTETGIRPVQYSRIILLLKNMKYLAQLPHNHLAWKAWRESFSLAEAGYTSLFTETCYVLEKKLPRPVVWNVPTFENVTASHISMIIEKVEESMRSALHFGMIKCPRTQDSLKDRKEYDKKAKKMVFKAIAFRHYLRVPTASHRKALIHLVTGNHQLAVERLRWNERNRPRVDDRNKRTCRFCHVQIEDPPHVLFECRANAEIVSVRNTFISKMLAEFPMHSRRFEDAWDLFRSLLADKKVINLFAKLAFDVLELVYAVDLLNK
ncbi:hypothetical protein D9757_010790 [Collybiopsis confluens]|uniref:Reverse transcriptase domain-containing protein n=1 Tax=Collybiopsis confluens TaxID=2823264 RepID=A0A8H5GUH6_9AGAR|nr:hypothetical protein D9757_010790 [Collybiopsis confluens]